MSFGLVKHNNNSISAITTPGNLAQGKLTLLQTQTASSSASISFTSNIDSTYPIYVFKFSLNEFNIILINITCTDIRVFNRQERK